MSKVRFDVEGCQFEMIDPDGSIATETAPGCDYEPMVSRSVRRLMAAGTPAFLDVGAHYGYFSCLAAAANPSSHVYAFEPGSEHIPTLKRNVATFGERVKHECLALSDRAGVTTFRGRTFAEAGTSGAGEIETVTYDSWRESVNERPSIAKVDVHGAEVLVLRGMTQALATEIDHLFLEVHAPHLLVDGTYAEIIDLVRGAGLTPYEWIEFREHDDPKQVALVDDALASFVDPSRWTDYHAKHERMILAVRDV